MPNLEKYFIFRQGFLSLKNDFRSFRTTTFFRGEEKPLRDFSNLLEFHFYRPLTYFASITAKNSIFFISPADC